MIYCYSNRVVDVWYNLLNVACGNDLKSTPACRYQNLGYHIAWEVDDLYEEKANATYYHDDIEYLPSTKPHHLNTKNDTQHPGYGSSCQYQGIDFLHFLLSPSKLNSEKR